MSLDKLGTSELCRDMVDAIREILGLSPLYDKSNCTVNRYVSKQMIESIGDGNSRKTSNGHQ